MTRGGRELWLCLRLPALALEVFGLPEEKALVVAEQQRVHASNVSALEPGLALSTAHALCAALVVVERRPEREWETLAQLAHWAYQFTPAVVVAADHCLLLEIGGCRRLYRGINPLLEIMLRQLRARGHQVQPALAHTPKAAWLLAQAAQEPALRGEELDADLLQRQLNALPTALLPVDEKILTALGRMGITTLEALAALPQAALGKRFGAPFIRYWQQLWGDHPDPQPPFVPAPLFQQSLAFIDGVHNRQMLIFPIKRLVQSLCDYLQARQLHCRALRWQLFDAHRLQAETVIELARAQNRWRNFLELSQLHLEKVPLREAVYALTLSSDSFTKAEPGTLRLFDDDDGAEADHSLLDRLAARLGAQALQRLRVNAAHWPEAAQQVLSAHSEPVIDTSPPAGPRPLWLLPEPAPIRQQDRQLFWQSPLQLLRGPERIGSHWWASPSPEQRDYYVALGSDGRLCWVFFETHSQRWFLHGLFG